MRKVRQRCAEIFWYSITTGSAEDNAAVDLSTGLSVHQPKNFSFLTAGEILGFLKALNA